MKKLAGFCVFLLCAYCTMKGQDRLVKTDSTALAVKILVVGPEEIRFKMYNNISGPVYVVSRAKVSRIVYENGLSQEITKPGTQSAGVQNSAVYTRRKRMSKADSLVYYRYSESISVNFLYFANNELGVNYHRDYIKKHFSIDVPFAIGVDQPTVTQYFYYRKVILYTLHRKLFETGLSFNYYPSYRGRINYFIGPALRYMQYAGTQVVLPSRTRPFITRNSSLSRTCFTINNGFLFRTRSRLQGSIFAGIGFNWDVAHNKVPDPVTHKKIDPIRNSVKVYMWSGISLGYSF